MPEADSGSDPKTDVQTPAAPTVRSIWGVSYIKRKLQERASKHKEETSGDKAARRTANATVWIAIFTIVLAAVSFYTLRAIHAGGADTHNLAVAAELQAQAQQAQTQRMEVMGETARAQALAALEQVDKLGAGVKETHRLALAAQDSAKVAQSALAKTDKQLRLSNRPWVGLADDERNGMVIGPIVFDASGNARIDYRIRPKNFSASAAQNVVSMARLVISTTYEDAVSEQKSVCGTGDPGKNTSGTVLFPNTAPIDTISASLVLKRDLDRRVTPGYVMRAWVVGCIFYRDQFDFLYRTKFMLIFQPQSPFVAMPNVLVEGVWLPLEMAFE